MIDKLDLSIKAINLRSYFREDGTSPIDIFGLAYEIDKLTVVFLPMSDNLSGMCIKSPESNVIAINSAMSLGRQRFSMAHELYHLFYDNRERSICSATHIKDDNEKSADQFASYLLLPPAALSETVKVIKTKNNIDKLRVSDVIRIEQYYKMSRQAILKRLIEDGELTDEEAEKYTENIIKNAVLLGYDDKLYKPTNECKTYGYYIKQAKEALEKEVISNGKYESLLLAAFRSDLVYGDDSYEGGEKFD